MTRVENINTTIGTLKNESGRLQSEIRKLEMQMNKTEFALVSKLKENEIEYIKSIISIIDDTIFSLRELR